MKALPQREFPRHCRPARQGSRPTREQHGDEQSLSHNSLPAACVLGQRQQARNRFALRPEARRCGDDDQPSRGAPSWLEARLKHSGGVDGVHHGYSLWHEHLEPGGLRRGGAQPHSTPNGPGWRPSVYRPDVRRDGFGISRTFCWRLVKLVDAMKLPCDTSAGCGVFLTHSQPGGNYEKRRNPCSGVRA
jgi:hypothetical protein